MEHNYRRVEEKPTVRQVPAFTTAVNQKNTVSCSRPRCFPFQPKAQHPSVFRKYYETRCLPIAIDFNTTQRRIRWLADLRYLDLNYYLPIFFEGLTEASYPYELLVMSGILQMMNYWTLDKRPQDILPELAVLLKRALRTYCPKIMLNACTVIRSLAVHTKKLGLPLIAYYKDFVPTMRAFINQNLNLGDRIDYSQRKNVNIGDAICRTLEILELTGGEEAYKQIKYLCPTYTSVVHN